MQYFSECGTVDNMFVTRVCLVGIVGMYVIQTAASRHPRMARSPDKIEMEIPNYTANYHSNGQSYQDNMNEESEYWQGEIDRYEDKGSNKQEEIEANRETNQEKYGEDYEKEKNRQEEKQETLNKEINEVQHDNNQEHINEYNYHINDFQNQGNATRDELLEESENKGERYEDKGTEHINEREDQAENFEVNGKGPSINYEPS